MLSPSAAQRQTRLEELINAEIQFGFAYDAEKIWLEEVNQHSSYENYSDWLLRNINQHLVDQPLLWGVSNRSGLYAEDDHNIWSADISNVESKGYSFELTDDDDITAFSIYFSFSVYGTRDQLSPTHLVHAFRRLFNAPYHLPEIKHRLLCIRDDRRSDEPKTGLEDYVNVGIEAVERESPTHCLLTLANHYDSWEGIDFIERQSLPIVTKPDPIRAVFEENRFPEWQLHTEIKYQNIPPRLVNSYREHFTVDVYTDYVQRFITKYAYVRQSMDCQCGKISLVHFQFKWGQLTDFKEYVVGDEISWEGDVLGYPELETVYVFATADLCCTACNERPNDTLICIKNNRIHSLQPTLLKNIKYTFQGPFISDDFISWDDYQASWIKNQWAQLLGTAKNGEFDHCMLPDLTDSMTQVWNENIKYLYLISKYRHSIPFPLFERCVLQRPIYIHNSANEGITLDSQLKTCAVLHARHNDREIIIKFYWGSLLDFPEYQVGDTIQWTEYATGDKLIDEVVYARGFIDEDHSTLVIIEIKHNRIVKVHFDYDKPDIDAITYNEKAYVFFGHNWLPWMVMPDRNFIASRRPVT